MHFTCTAPISLHQFACRIETTYTDVMFLVLTSPWSLRNRFPSPKSAILGFMTLSIRMFPALMSPCAKIVWDSSCRNAKPVAVPNRISNLVLQSIVFLRSTCAKEKNRNWAHSYSNICLHSLVHWREAVAQKITYPNKIQLLSSVGLMRTSQNGSEPALSVHPVSFPTFLSGCVSLQCYSSTFKLMVHSTSFSTHISSICLIRIEWLLMWVWCDWIYVKLVLMLG